MICLKTGLVKIKNFRFHQRRWRSSIYPTGLHVLNICVQKCIVLMRSLGSHVSYLPLPYLLAYGCKSRGILCKHENSSSGCHLNYCYGTHWVWQITPFLAILLKKCEGAFMFKYFSPISNFWACVEHTMSLFLNEMNIQIGCIDG